MKSTSSPVPLPFPNRSAAGRILAARLLDYASTPDLLVLGLPRGGVPVAAEVARALDAPLDIFVVRKLGMPGQEELAMGAIATGGVRVLNESVVRHIPNAEAVVERVAVAEMLELERRETEYRDGRPPPRLRGRTVILVDDGLATGATMRAAVAGLRQHQVARCVVAVPVGSPDTCATLGKEADDLICVATPELFYGVGQFYEDFSQTTDDEVRKLLAASRSGGF